MKIGCLELDYLCWFCFFGTWTINRWYKLWQGGDTKKAGNAIFLRYTIVVPSSAECEISVQTCCFLNSKGCVFWCFFLKKIRGWTQWGYNKGKWKIPAVTKQGGTKKEGETYDFRVVRGKKLRQMEMIDDDSSIGNNWWWFLNLTEKNVWRKWTIYLRVARDPPPTIWVNHGGGGGARPQVNHQAKTRQPPFYWQNGWLHMQLTWGGPAGPPPPRLGLWTFLMKNGTLLGFGISSVFYKLRAFPFFLLAGQWAASAHSVHGVHKYTRQRPTKWYTNSNVFVWKMSLKLYFFVKINIKR